MRFRNDTVKILVFYLLDSLVCQIAPVLLGGREVITMTLHDVFEGVDSQ